MSLNRKVSNEVVEIVLDFDAGAMIFNSDSIQVLNWISNIVGLRVTGDFHRMMLTNSFIVKFNRDCKIGKDCDSMPTFADKILKDKDLIIMGLKDRLSKFEWKSIDKVKPNELDCDDSHTLLASSVKLQTVEEMTLDEVLNENSKATHWMSKPKPPRVCVR